MFLTYIRDIFRGLRRAVSASIISIIGLSIGIAMFMLIMLYVRTELRVNKNLKEYENIYRVSTGDGTGWQGLPPGIGEILIDRLPEVKSFVRLDGGGTNHVIKIDNIPVRPGKLVYADSSFFRIFTLPFKMGDPSTCLDEKFNIVLTESLSESLFGNESPVGKLVRLDNRFDAKITGVIYDPAYQTNIEGDLFISFHSMPEVKGMPDLFDCWGCYNYNTYLLLEKNTDPASASVRINNVLRNFGKENSIPQLIDAEFSITNLHNAYFGPEERPEFRKGNYSQLRLLGSVGVLILIIAVINYVNLSTAYASYRFRQLVLRKILGASRINLLLVIIGEAILVSLISIIVALLLLGLIRPLFNSIMSLDIQIEYLVNPWFIPVCLLAGIVLGILSGLYPALSITKLSISGSLGSDINNASRSGVIRKVLTAFQVFVSIALIGSTLTIFSQLRYINMTDLGFDKDILVYMPMNEEIIARRDAFRQELIKHSGIENASYSYSSYRTSQERWSTDYLGQEIQLFAEVVDEHYIRTLGLDLVAGRDFRGPQDEFLAIVNESANSKYFNDKAVGVNLDLIGSDVRIVGVVGDFNFQTLDKSVEPMIMVYHPQGSYLCSIRLSENKFSDAIKHMESVWKDFCLEYPFEYNFVSKLYADRYFKQKSVGELLIFFSVISVLIACLGIYGLATFTVEKRSKETGIRKVNGASIPELVKLLSSDINRIVVYSVLPAFVVVYLVMNPWLNDFAYRISMPWWGYLVSAIMVWMVALLATIGKTMRTARINPAEVLRTE